MARIGENAFREYRDGQDRLTAREYTAERELIRLALNDVEDKLDEIGIDTVREIASDITSINERVNEAVNTTQQKIEETEVLNQETTQRLQEVQSTVEDLRTNGTGIDSQARQDVQQVNEGLIGTQKRTSGFVNVREFGVKENDGKDYTKEMQNAIDYAIENGLVLYSNPGTVKISSPGLIIWRPLNWIGARGRSYAFNPTIISYSGDGAALTFRKKDTAKGEFLPNESGQLAAPNFKGLSIVREFSGDSTYSQGYGNKGYGMDFYRTSEGVFEDCTVTGFKVGIHAQGLSITEFIKCDVKMNTYGVWLATGAENGSRSYHNPKVALRDCNFYINYEAHVLPGYNQNVIDNCHMEISKRTFYFPMKPDFRIVDTFDVYSLNNNTNVPVDSYYTGNFPEINAPVFIDIQFDPNAPIVLNNIKIENSRIRSYGEEAKIINLNHNNNNISGVDIVWNNNKVLGAPLGLISSSTPNQPLVNVMGLNKFKTHDDTNYPQSFNVYGTGGVLIGFEYNGSIGGVRTLGRVALNYRTVNVVPTNTVAPLFMGEELLDTANNMWYKAYGLASDTWRPMTMNYRTSGISPIGATSPRFIGEEYLNLTDKKWYKATGLTNNDWVVLN